MDNRSPVPPLYPDQIQFQEYFNNQHKYSLKQYAITKSYRVCSMTIYLDTLKTVYIKKLNITLCISSTYSVCTLTYSREVQNPNKHANFENTVIGEIYASFTRATT